LVYFEILSLTLISIYCFKCHLLDFSLCKCRVFIFCLIISSPNHRVMINPSSGSGGEKDVKGWWMQFSACEYFRFQSVGCGFISEAL